MADAKKTRSIGPGKNFPPSAFAFDGKKEKQPRELTDTKTTASVSDDGKKEKQPGEITDTKTTASVSDKPIMESMENMTMDAQITEKKSETIRSFAEALSVGQQAEQKYQQEETLRKRAANGNRFKKESRVNG
jgi:hypothetical protein